MNWELRCNAMNEMLRVKFNNQNLYEISQMKAHRNEC